VTLTMADMPGRVGEDGPVGPSEGPRADRPKRRSFSAAYKLEILAEYERLGSSSERGALLRRERLYHSHIQKWREARGQGALTGLADRPAGRSGPSPAEVEAERLRKENERLAAELAKTKTALDIMGKARELLEMLSESSDSDAKPKR
jgi:transposase